MDEVMETWMKSLTDFWGGMQNVWMKPMETAFAPKAKDPDSFKSASAAMETALKNWEFLQSVISDPEAVEPLLKTAGAAPQMIFKLAQGTFGGFLQLHQKWMELTGRIGKTTEAYSFDDIDENLFKAWAEIYEKEFRKFFQIPQLGLTRSYQEHLNHALDQYNIHQAAMAEFVRMLCLPLNRSYEVMKEKVREMADQGTLPEDPRALYSEWIKVLEGHYMTLYQSPAYHQVLSNTLDALSGFSEAKNKVLEDFMSGLPIPSQSDIDDMSREIYELKKRIRQLEKQSN
ncbi:MAG: poly(R)-hydroxyalkanoic acid synthase subunit PhaE [Desulfobacterales bacterium]